MFNRIEPTVVYPPPEFLRVQPVPETRDTLLLRLRDPADQAAWDEFVELYRPVIYRIAIARGLQHADAMDLLQTVFVSVAQSIDRWEKQTPATKFRHWLLRVAKNATLNAVTRRPPDQAGAGVTDLLKAYARPDDETSSRIDWEYRRQLYNHAAERVRSEVEPDTWRAFSMTAIDGIKIEVAASELGKSVGTIYASRSRVMKRLSQAIDELTGSYE
ncbi:MAG: sigma-70 family RNA polymerase sigma factor [Planctomycetota bacterium]